MLLGPLSLQGSHATILQPETPEHRDPLPSFPRGAPPAPLPASRPRFHTLELFPFCRERGAGRQWGTSPPSAGQTRPRWPGLGRPGAVKWLPSLGDALLAAGDPAAEPGVPAGADQAPADPGRAGLRVTQSAPKAGRAGQTCSVPPGCGCRPGAERDSPSPRPGERHQAGRAESLQTACPTPTAAALGQHRGGPQNHPPRRQQPAGLCSHPGTQCQHGLTAKVPGATTMPRSRSQEVATEQLPVPTRVSPGHSRVMPGSASGTAVHGGCPSPAARAGAAGWGLPAPCHSTGGSALLSPPHASRLRPHGWEERGGQGAGAVPLLVGIPGVVHSPSPCAMSPWRAHTSCRSLPLVHGPDAQVWAGPAGGLARARPASQPRVPGRRERLGRDAAAAP